MTKRLTRKEAAEDMMITVLSDVWLDVEGVLDALGEMLKGFVENAMVPSAIVLMGNFISTPLGSSSVVNTCEQRNACTKSLILW